MVNKYSCWEEAIYEVTGATTFTYNILDENNTLIYSARAYVAPDESTIRINISEIVRNYLNCRLPKSATDGTEFVFGQHTLPNAVLGFTLTDEKGNELEKYLFLNCWDYKTRFSDIDNTTMNFNINRPINTHYAVGEYIFRSILTKQNQVKVTIYGEGYEIQNTCGYGALYYSNGLGGWDAFLIEGMVKKKESLEKYNISNKAMADTLQFGDRTINNTITESWELTTHYLTDEESEILVMDLFGSNDIYFHDFKDDTIRPVIITDTSTDIKTWKGQGRKHYSYTINISNSLKKQRI